MRLVIVSILLAACVSEKQKDDPTGDDDDDTTGECSVDDDCATGTICDGGACVPGDRDSEDDPTPVPFTEDADDPQTVPGAIEVPGDVDWYVYDSPGEEWVSLRTSVDDPEAIDTVLTLYSPDGGEWAQMDNFPVWPYRVSGFDSVLYAWLPDAGEWTFAVEDATSFYDDVYEPEEQRGGEEMTYEVLVRGAGGTSENDSPTNTSITLTLPDGNSIFTTGVRIDEDGDLDHITLETPVADLPLEVWASSGAGSTAAPRVRLFDATETLIADKTDVGASGWLSLFSPEASTYRVEASSDATGGADTDWFVLYARTYEAGDDHPFFGTNVYELELEPNDGPVDATPLTVNDLPDYDAYRLEGAIDGAGDADFFGVEVEQDHYVSVRCWSERFGSLADLSVEVFDGTQALVGSGASPDGEDFYVLNAQTAAGGPHLVRIFADSPSAGGPGHYYRCAVFTTPQAL